jgi:hypothetical protein
VRIGHAAKKLPHTLPVAQSSFPIVRTSPLSRPNMPPRGVERFASLFDMVGNQRCPFVKLVGVEGLKCAGDRAMQTGAAIAELGLVGDFLRQRMKTKKIKRFSSSQ